MEEKSQSIFTLAGLKLERNLPEIITITSGKGGVGKTFSASTWPFCCGNSRKRCS
jgi:Mrp family chromosome partitioning ATPase